MKRTICLLTILCLLLSLFAGCGKKTESGPATPGSTSANTPGVSFGTPEDKENPRPRAEFGLAWIRDGGLNPYKSTSVTNLPIRSLMYEGMFVVNSNYTVDAVLCDRCSSSESLYTWYFELCHDATFSDGTGVSSADVVASWKAAERCGLYDTRFRCIGSMAVDDPYTVVVTMTIPVENPGLIFDFPILKASTIDDDAPIGTGPYYLLDSTLYRNRTWWQHDREPTIDVSAVELFEVKDTQEMRNEFEFGEVDAVYTDPYMVYAAEFHGDNERWGVPTTEMQYLAFNDDSTYFFSSALRSMVTYSVDRNTIVSQFYYGYGAPSTLPVNPSSVFYDSGLASSYAYNVDTFRQLLATCGIAPDPGNPIHFIVCTTNQRRVQAAQYIADELSRLGLFVTLEPLDEDFFLYALATGDFDMYMAEIKLPNSFDLAAFFNYGYYTSIGGINEDETAAAMMRSAIENSGNYYDLCKTIMSRGLICPIMFKVAVLYTTRGTLRSDEAPSVSSLLQVHGRKSFSDCKVVKES